jgi:hypothetical protein
MLSARYFFPLGTAGGRFMRTANTDKHTKRDYADSNGTITFVNQEEISAWNNL